MKRVLFAIAMFIASVGSVLAGPNPKLVVDANTIVELTTDKCTSPKIKKALVELGASPAQVKEAMGKAHNAKVRLEGKQVAACYMVQEDAAYFFDENGAQVALPLEAFGVKHINPKERM